MKDFKNENEYGNMKTEETYEGILLKTGDEGYRYFSSSGGSGSGDPSGGSSGPSGGSSGPSGGSSGPSGGSSGPSGGSSDPSGGSGVVSYDCSYCLDTGVLNGSMCPHCINVDWGCESSSVSTDLITLNITATCGNSGNMTIELYGTGATGTIVSQSASSNRVEASGQITAGTYTIVVWAYLNTGGLRSKEEIIVVKNANSNSASDYNCAYCNNTGLININNKTVCANCEVGNTYIRPIRFAHNYSKQPSGYEIDFAALCEDGWNMCLDLYREDKSWSAPSRCVSALGVANTYYPIGEGRYIIEAKAITSDGYTRTQKEIIEISEAKAQPEYPEGFSYIVNSYDEDTETCNVTMVARYKEAPGTYLDIVSADGSTEEIIVSAYRDGSLVVITADMAIGNYIAKPNINYVNFKYAKDTIEFNISADQAPNYICNADKILGSKRKILLLYAGAEYASADSSYPPQDIQAIFDTGATEFLITTANSYNLDVNENLILTEIPFVSCSTSSSFDTVYDNCNQDGIYKNYFNSLGFKKEHFNWGENNATDVKNLYKYIWGWWDDNNAESINPSEYYKASDDSSNAAVYQNNTDMKVFAAVNRGILRSGNNSYLKYYNCVVSLANQLIAKDPACKLWIGLPPIIDGASFRAEEYTTAYIDLINKLRNESGIWENVVGIYYGTEDVPGGYSAFNISSYSVSTTASEERANSEDFDNAVVKNMRSIKAVLGNKLFLWIPYYHTSVVERVGYIVNRTDIFDIVILQTSYFFDAENTAVDMDLVEDCVVYGKCLNSSINASTDFYKKDGEFFPNESFVVGNFVDSSTIRKNIGFEVEMDSCSGNWSSNDTSEKETRHNTFVSKFGKYVSQTNVDIAFYPGTINDMLRSDLNIIGNVGSFFEDGTVAETE